MRTLPDKADLVCKLASMIFEASIADHRRRCQNASEQPDVSRFNIAYTAERHVSCTRDLPEI